MGRIIFILIAMLISIICTVLYPSYTSALSIIICLILFIISIILHNKRKKNYIEGGRNVKDL